MLLLLLKLPLVFNEWLFDVLHVLDMLNVLLLYKCDGGAMTEFASRTSRELQDMDDRNDDDDDDDDDNNDEEDDDDEDDDDD
jgi:hypothetical protein